MVWGVESPSEPHTRTRSPTGDKVGVAVLGMSRSGTSAVARMFALAGCFAGREEDLIPESDSNPTGFWENVNVWRTNERILARVGGSWLDPPATERQVAARAWAVPELKALFARLLDEAAGAPLVLKDPRVGVMLPLWQSILDEHLHPVLVIRDPVEVALSLSRRDGSPTSLALAAWQLHMTAVLRHFQGRVVTIAPYHALLGSAEVSELTVGSAIGHLRQELADRIKPAWPGISPDPALQRHRTSPGEHEHLMSNRQLELWRELAALEPGDQRIEIPERLLECGPAILDSVRAETERLVLRRRLQVAEEKALALTRDLAEERRRADDAEAAHRWAAGWLQVVYSSTSWRITAPLRTSRRTAQRMVGRGRSRNGAVTRSDASPPGLR